MDNEKLMKLMARGKSDKGKDNKKYGKFSSQLTAHLSFSFAVVSRLKCKKKINKDNEDDLAGSKILKAWHLSSTIKSR